jgi:hypothetical protein
MKHLSQCIKSVPKGQRFCVQHGGSDVEFVARPLRKVPLQIPSWNEQNEQTNDCKGENDAPNGEEGTKISIEKSLSEPISEPPVDESEQLKETIGISTFASEEVTFET